MSSPVIAVYPGTFDPLTLGHEDIVRRAARMFDRVVIAVAMAHHKKTLFTLPERLELTRAAMADWRPMSKLALSSYVLPPFLIAYGTVRIESSIAAIIVGSVPVFTAGLSYLLAGRERPDARGVGDPGSHRCRRHRRARGPGAGSAAGSTQEQLAGNDLPQPPAKLGSARRQADPARISLDISAPARPRIAR